MAIRFRAHLRYTVGSGYAQWVHDQMQVRLGMAFHNKEGTPAEERSKSNRDIVSTGPQSSRRENITIDVFWPDGREDLAQDTINTLQATIPWLRPDESSGGNNSWMDWHYCNHDIDPPIPCGQVEWKWPT